MAKIDEEYHKLLNKIINEGFKYEDPNRKNVYRLQIPTYTITHDFKDGFPAITTKKLAWKSVVGELLWILRGDTNIKYLVDNNINIWNKDAYNYYLKNHPNYKKDYDYWIERVKRGLPKIGDCGRIYGYQWRNFRSSLSDKMVGFDKEEVDQIDNLIKGLKENPMGTRHIVTAWNPAELDDMALPPCHWSFEILVEPYTFIEQSKFAKKNLSSFLAGKPKDIPDYQFTLKWHQRSVDTFLGKM